MTISETAADSVLHFEALAVPHMKDLFRAAASMLGSRTEAEDVVQEVYLQAWKSCARFTPGTDFRAWMFGILFNVIRHQRRKWFKFKLVEQSDEILEQTLAYEPPVAQDLSDEEILAALAKLPSQYRDVVLLSDVYDYTYKEIQKSLSIPAGTVMSRLNRGRKLLRAHLAAAGVSTAIEGMAQTA